MRKGEREKVDQSRDPPSIIHEFSSIHQGPVSKQARGDHILSKRDCLSRRTLTMFSFSMIPVSLRFNNAMSITGLFHAVTIVMLAARNKHFQLAYSEGRCLPLW